MSREIVLSQGILELWFPVYSEAYIKVLNICTFGGLGKSWRRLAFASGWHAGARKRQAH